MPLLASSDLPAFESIRREGIELTGPPGNPRLPTLRIGLLNLMPDAALRATDRQFLRQVAAISADANVAWHPFTLAEWSRGKRAKEYVINHYEKVEAVQAEGLDALIITGANPAQQDLTKEPFWDPLVEVMRWATDTTHSILFSCLATHAALFEFSGVERVRLPQKRWGVYSHEVVIPHELISGLTGPIEVPHSRWYDIDAERMGEAGLDVLLESEDGGVLMAADRHGSNVYLQGHPEYEQVSLLKEYTREVGRYHRGERADYPPVPMNYFPSDQAGLLQELRRQVVDSRRSGAELPPIDQKKLSPAGEMPWSSAGRAIYRNWLQRVIRSM